MKSEMHHYTECGLDNVFLGSGVTLGVEPGYGQTFAIEKMAGLHRAIADSLISQARTLNGAEFRFLRLELDLSQRRLAEMLSTNEQSVAKWEKAREKPVANRSADRLLRLIFANSRRDSTSELARLFEIITETDTLMDDEQIQLELDPDGWHSMLAA
jgi:DNA-binding transcriptional regulator YiaG